MEAAFKEALIKAGVDYDNTLEKRLMGSEDLYEKCLNMFADGTSLQDYQKAIAEKDYEAAFNAVHAMKGTAANIGVITVKNVKEMSALPTFEERKSLLEADTQRGAIPHLEIINEALRFDKYDDAGFSNWSAAFEDESSSVIALIKSFRK